MNVTKKEYDSMTKKRLPPTKIYKTWPSSFLVGGAICVIGEGLSKLYTHLGLEKVDAGTMVSVTLIFISVVLTGLKIYGKFAKYAGAGTLVPITGFANSVASTALEFKSEGYILGVGAKMFSIAGPVIVYGITASIIYGIIYFIAGKL